MYYIKIILFFHVLRRKEYYKMMNIILLIIIILELIISLYYLTNKKIKRDNKSLLIASIIILLLSVIIYFLKHNLFNRVISLYNFILLISAILASIILKLIYNNLELENKYSKILKCTLEYEKIIDDQGEKNHEYNNQLLILKGYLNNKKKLIEYLNTIIEDHKTGQNYKIKQLTNFSEGGIKELLYYKLCIIRERNIKYYLYISKETSNILEGLNLKIYKDITKILGVIIDNAIDSAYDSIEKEISIDFSLEDNYIIISISNSYNKKIDMKNIGKRGFSTKGKGHGFGLKLVKEIIKKNKKLELISEYNDKYYIQTLLIDSK